MSTESARLIQSDLDLTREQRELFVGSLNFFAIFGALGAQPISDRYGRRLTFLLAAVGFIVGTLIMVTAVELKILLLGRAMVGIGVGIGLAIDPMYISEVTPANHRGELVTWSEVAMNVGASLGFSSGWWFSDLPDGQQWRAMLLLGAVMPTLMVIVCLTIMPESPRWLISNRRDTEAVRVLKKMYPDGHDIPSVVQDIKDADRRDRKTSMAVGWYFIASPSPAVRRMMLVGVGAAVAQQLVGIDALQYYLVDVIANSGIQSKQTQSLILMMLGLIKLAFVFVGGKTFDLNGRRIGLTVSLVGMAASLVLVAAAFSFGDQPLATFTVLLGMALYLSFFSVGMGPGAWLIPSEVFATVIRAKAMSVATCASRIVATFMASSFLTLADTIGWSIFFCLLAGVCLAVCAFFRMYLPEAKGRSLEEMSLVFAELTGDRTLLDAEAELEKLRQEPTVSSKDPVC